MRKQDCWKQLSLLGILDKAQDIESSLNAFLEVARSSPFLFKHTFKEKIAETGYESKKTLCPSIFLSPHTPPPEQLQTVVKSCAI